MFLSYFRATKKPFVVCYWKLWFYFYPAFSSGSTWKTGSAIHYYEKLFCVQEDPSNNQYGPVLDGPEMYEIKYVRSKWQSSFMICRQHTTLYVVSSSFQDALIIPSLSDICLFQLRCYFKTLNLIREGLPARNEFLAQLVSIYKSD